MTINDRQNTILDWVRTTKSASIENLADHFNVTTQTIRRDINYLCELGMLRRVHGGVQLPSTSTNISMSARSSLNASAKKAIAAKVADYIKPDSSVFLGIGTTVDFVARALLNHTGLTVITNNFDAARTLSANPDISIMLSGGRLRPDDGDLVGPEAVAFFNNFMVDVGILGCGGLSHAGLLDFQPEEVAMSRAILANSRRRILVADNSKWHRNALMKVADFNKIDAFFTDTLKGVDVNFAEFAPTLAIYKTE